MEANEWHYTGEGGKHALFAYRSPLHTSEPSKWHGQLLRLDKKYLRQAAGWKEAETIPACRPKTANRAKDQYQSTNQNNGEDDNPFSFLQDVMKPHFQQYLDLPTSIILPLSFVEELHRKTQMAQPCPIPEARRKDWIPTDKDGLCQDSVPSWLIWDYRHAFSATSMGPCWSMEIKPKAGYLASSPLVDPKHIAKFTQSRFVLLQTLDRMGYSDQIHRGWKQSPSSNETSDEVSQSTSSYDPLDLFSGHPSRIKQAIEALWDSPQNNFKLWHTPIGSMDGPVLVACDPHYRVGTDTKGDPTQSNNPQECFLPTSLLLDVLSSILQSECAFLQRLRQWQLLDVLDGDGAILIYQRLVELCNGSHKEAQNMIDANYSTISQEQGTGSITIGLGLPGSPFTLPVNHAACPAFHALCQELYRFSSALQTLQTNPCDENDNSKRHKHDNILAFLQKEHETSRTFCLGQIDLIQSKEACCYLLRNWLLSLAVCDISFFVTFQRVPKTKESQCAKGMTEMPSILKQQSEDKPGTVEISMTSEGQNETATFQYVLKMIDCDKKPSKKLETRQQKEQVFQYLQERMS